MTLTLSTPAGMSYVTLSNHNQCSDYTISFPSAIMEAVSETLDFNFILTWLTTQKHFTVATAVYQNVFCGILGTCMVR
jgi:hypothetical protein